MATINNGESGSSVRTKLNDIINKVEGVTSINNDIDVTGTVTADGLTVDAGYIKVSGTSTGLFIEETDTTDVNTWLSNQGGDLRLFTVNDTLSVYTKRMEVDHATGDISFYEDTGTTPKFFWDASAESLGIGTSSPSRLLHVSGNSTLAQFESSTTGSYLELKNSGGNAAYIGSASGSNFVVETGGSERMRIDSSGNTRPGSDNAYDLGTASFRWDDVYATNALIQTSDRNEKQDIDVLSDAEQRVAVACKGLLRKFRWKSAVAEKGDDARIHFGIIAQDLQAAFEAEGLDAGRYAMFIHTTWTDEETGEERSRMGVRYSELLAFIIAAI